MFTSVRTDDLVSACASEKTKKNSCTMLNYRLFSTLPLCLAVLSIFSMI
jgi:hypothetical protein